MVYVHVDDLMVAASEQNMAHVKCLLEKELHIKWGNVLCENLWSRYLGRELRQTPHGFQTRIPPTYFEDLLTCSMIEKSRAVTTPFAGTSTSELENVALPADRAASYRRAVGQLMWTLSERPDLSYATKELARSVATPTYGSEQ